MNEEKTIQKDLAQRLVTALKEEGFVLFGQMIMPLAPRGIERPFQEILVRFREEEEKLLPPGTFFPLLEEYRLMPYVDRWVVSRLAKWLQRLRELKPDLPLPRNAINLAADTLYDPKFADYTRKHIESARLPAETMNFDLSWTIASGHMAQVRNLQAELKPSGCTFTVAGFDGSEASFALLKTLAPEFVKFNYSMVKDVDRGLAASERVESINTRCQSLGMKTIAEYVESPVMLDQLRLIGVDFGQGLGIAPPKRLP